MTDITPLIKSNQMVVQSYGAKGFKISGQVFESDVIVLPNRVIVWTAGDMAALMALKDETDVILMGTGKAVKHLRKNERPQGLHLEAMDTGAACRTYNALLADGRRVAAALIRPL